MLLDALLFVHKKNVKKPEFLDALEPSKSHWDCSESAVLACAPGSLKVVKNDSKMTTLNT